MEYEIESLRLSILAGLEQACPHCGKYYGLDSWGVSYISAMERGGRGQHKLKNLVVTCARCAVARGSLRVDVWLDILASLNAEDDAIAEKYLDSLHQLRLAAAINGKGHRVLPGPAVPRVTRESHCSAKISPEK